MPELNISQGLFSGSYWQCLSSVDQHQHGNYWSTGTGGTTVELK